MRQPRKLTPEGAILRQVRQWLGYHGWQTVRIHQSLGSEKGIPDLFAFRAGVCVGVEVKTPKGKLSEWQELMKSKLEGAGIRYLVARSIDDLAGMERER